MSLQKTWWRISLQRLCLVEVSLQIFSGRDFYSIFFLAGMSGMSLQKLVVENVSSEKNRGECLCKDFVW